MAMGLLPIAIFFDWNKLIGRAQADSASLTVFLWRLGAKQAEHVLGVEIQRL